MRAIAVNAASIEPRETIREIASATPNTAAAPNPTGHDNASNTPSPVAADLPPVKFSQIERPCPSSAASPARQTPHGTKVCGSSVAGGVTDGNVQSHGKNQPAKTIAATPFSTSTSSTASAGHLPSVRNTLVAPVDLEPCSRISMPLSSFPAR